MRQSPEVPIVGVVGTPPAVALSPPALGSGLALLTALAVGVGVGVLLSVGDFRTPATEHTHSDTGTTARATPGRPAREFVTPRRVPSRPTGPPTHPTGPPTGVAP